MTAYRNPDPFFESPVEGRPMQLCPKCKCIKPTSEFTRLLSGLEMVNRGYSTEKRVRVETSQCRACREPGKRKRPRTRNELHNAKVMGELRPAVVEEIMDRRELKARAVASAAQQKRWDNDYDRAWAPVMLELKNEIHRSAQAQKYLRHPPERANLTSREERTAFFGAYLTAMRALRERLKMLFITPRGENGQRRRPTSTWWVDYFTTEEWVALHDLWQAIDLDTRVKLRPPDLLHRNGEARPDDPARDMVRR